MYLGETKAGDRKLEAWKSPLRGEEVVTPTEWGFSTVDGPRVSRWRFPADQHRSTLCDDVSCRGGEWADVEWSPDGAHLAFVSTSRDHKHEQLRVAEAATGEIGRASCRERV